MDPLLDAAERCLSETSFSYAELRSQFPRRRIDRCVEDGTLVRLRKGTYVRGDCPPALADAARHGGRLDCVSLLQSLGVFVLSTTATHIQMERTATRIEPRSNGIIRHWRTSRAPSKRLAADIGEALAEACRCQAPRAAVATLDSAMRLGLADETAIAEVFARLPRRFQAIRSLLDPRSESGPESLVRLLLRGLGLSFELQVDLRGVGRVDFVVEGWLIIECDSEAHHGGWDRQRRDRRRDLAAAALGYATIRPIAEDIMFRPDRVIDAIRGLIATRFDAHNVGTVRPRGRKVS